MTAQTSLKRSTVTPTLPHTERIQRTAHTNTHTEQIKGKSVSTTFLYYVMYTSSRICIYVSKPHHEHSTIFII